MQPLIYTSQGTLPREEVHLKSGWMDVACVQTPSPLTGPHRIEWILGWIGKDQKGRGSII